jgi:hypothetical protein
MENDTWKILQLCLSLIVLLQSILDINNLQGLERSAIMGTVEQKVEVTRRNRVWEFLVGGLAYAVVAGAFALTGGSLLTVTAFVALAVALYLLHDRYDKYDFLVGMVEKKEWFHLVLVWANGAVAFLIALLLRRAVNNLSLDQMTLTVEITRSMAYSFGGLVYLYFWDRLDTYRKSS